MAKEAKKRTARGRAQDRARVAGRAGLRGPVRSEESPKMTAAVKKALKKIGNSPEGVEKRLGR